MPHAPSLPHRSSQPAPGPTTAPPTDVVVEARDLTKIYGSGEARVARGSSMMSGVMKQV